MALLLTFLALASFAGSQAQPITWQTLPFATIEGPTIRLVRTGAARACNQACVDEPTCTAAVHFGGAKRCWLKAQPLTEIMPTFKGYLKVLVRSSANYDGYIEADFVQQPRATDPGALSITGMQVEGTVANSQACQRLCFETYNDKCIYSQLNIGTNICFIARDCAGPDCEDVRTYWKIGVRNFSRVYCKNAAYRRAWGNWTGSYPKGENRCTDVFLNRPNRTPPVVVVAPVTEAPLVPEVPAMAEEESDMAEKESDMETEDSAMADAMGGYMEEEPAGSA